MKKQIFILTLCIAAFLAGTSAFAQTTLTQGVTSTQLIDPLSCVATSLPLHPYPGQSYTYTMTGDVAAEEQPDTWTWFATKDNSFMTAGALDPNTSALVVTSGELMATSVNYGLGNSGATNSVDITWSPEILANTIYNGANAGEPTFVVGYATGVKCADNMQVYQINPQFNFTIDIAAIDESDATLAWDAPAEECVSLVESAIYNNGTTQIDMNYGTDTIYFEVAASNFVNSFVPTFRVLSGLLGDQSALISVHSTLVDAQTPASAGVASQVFAVADVAADGTGLAWNTGGETFDAATSTEIVEGVSLYVRVIISNNTYESLATNPFILAVDAQDNGGTGIWDMEDDDCPADPVTATNLADWYDNATQNITPRPTIIMDGAAMQEGNGLAPDDVIIKTQN